MRVLCLSLVALSMSPAAAAASDLTGDVRTFAARFGWPGAAAIEVTAAGTGAAVVQGVCRGGEPLRADTPLLIGSVSKALTAQAVLRLADAGRLTLDGRIGALAPQLPPRAAALTVRRLLTHQSGFSGRQGLSEGRAPDLARLTPEGASDRRTYSNLNYSLVGALAAEAAGAPFSTALQDLVARPRRLPSVAVGSAAARACGHALVFGAVLPRPEPTWSDWAAPAGFLQASPQDLARLEAQLLDDPRSGAGGPDDPLVGWKRATIGGEPVYSHSGQIGGARATLVLLPGRHRGLVLVVNRGGDLLQNPVDRLALRAVARLQDRSPPPIPWPWERVVRLAALLALLIEAAALVRCGRARPAVTPPRLALALCLAVAVPCGVLWATSLTLAALWRLAPDLAVLLVAGPALAALRWAFARALAATPASHDARRVCRSHRSAD